MHCLLKGQFFCLNGMASILYGYRPISSLLDSRGINVAGVDLQSQLYLRKISSYSYRTEQLHAQMLKTYLIQTHYN